MKKILIILFLCFVWSASFCQFINTQTVGSSTTDYKSRGGITADSLVHLAPIIFADTTAANWSVVSKYSGSLIQVAGGQIWWRSLNPNQWHIFASSTGGSYLLISDTAAMLANRLKISDTTFMLSNRLKISDTAYMMSNHLRISDTLTMLSGYARSGNVPAQFNLTANAPIYKTGSYPNITVLADTGRSAAELVSGGSLNKVRDSLQANITASVSGVSNVSGTGALSFTNPTTTPVGTIDTAWSGGLTTRLRTRQIADSLQNNINARGFGSVTSIATTNGILGGTITTTGTLQVDSSAYSTKAYVLKVASDTSSSLRTLINTKGTGNGTVTSVAAGTGMSFTTITTTGNVNADTSVLSTKAYVLKVASDTSTSLRTLINTKGTGNGTVTSVGLSLPSIFSVSGSPVTTSGTLTATLSNQSKNLVWASPISGSPAQPTFRSLVAADLPNTYLPISDTSSMLGGYNLQRVTNLGATTYNPLVLLKQSLPFIFLQSGGSNYGTIQSDANNQWSFGFSSSSSTNGTPSFYWDTTGKVTFLYGGISNGVIDYNRNYGSLFNNNSLVDKKYVDSLHSISGTQFWQRSSNTLSPLNSGDNISTTGNITDNRLNTDSLLSNTNHKVIVYDTVLFNRPTRFFDSLGIFPSQLGDLYKSQAVQINGALEMYSNAVGTLGRDIDFIKTRNGGLPSPGDEFGYINGRTKDTSSIGPNSAPAIQMIYRVGQHVGQDFTSGIVEFKVRSTDGEYPGFNNLILNDKKQAVVGKTLIVGDSLITNGNQFFGSEDKFIQFGSNVNTAPFIAPTTNHDLYLGTKNISAFRIDSLQNVYLPKLTGSATSHVLYYNPSTKQVTYDTAYTGSGKLNISDTASMLSNYRRNTTLITNSNLTNSTISGVSLGSNLNSLTATNATLTFSGSYNGSAAETIGINLSNANTWSSLQSYSSGINASGYTAGANGTTWLEYGISGGTGNINAITRGTGFVPMNFGASSFSFNASAKAPRFIGNSGTDNTIDAIQSGGGSILGNLYRSEGKIQATSTTIDATATVWNDNTNGSTVTYTLPTTSSLQGGNFMFLKSGTGTLTLSGTIIDKTGTSQTSIAVTSASGLIKFWFNGTTWYQVN